MEKESGSSSTSSATPTTIPFRCRPLTKKDIETVVVLPSNYQSSSLTSSTGVTTTTSAVAIKPDDVDAAHMIDDNISNDLTKMCLSAEVEVQKENVVLINKSTDTKAAVSAGTNDVIHNSSSDTHHIASTAKFTTTTRPAKCPPVFCVNPAPAHIRNLPKTQSLDLGDDGGGDVGVAEGGAAGAIHRTVSRVGGESSPPFAKGVMPKFDQNRPIYPNVPYSPYGSPYGSPRSGRRRPPLRESRRVSIEQTGSFLQLNQYKLMDQIGQVCTVYFKKFNQIYLVLL